MGLHTIPKKILALGIVNLVLVGLALFVFANMHYGLGPESILVGPARDRILAIGDEFRREQPGNVDLDGLVKKYGERVEAEATLVRPRGERVAGADIALPQEVRDRLRDGGAMGRPEGGLGRPDRLPRENGPSLQGGPPPRNPFFFVVSRQPTFYWAGVRLPVRTPEGEDLPAVMLFRSTTLLNTKLFLNWPPWILLAVVVTGITTLCWLPFLRGLTKTIAQMDQVTQQIAMGQLSSRVDEKRTDELGRLGKQINRMAGELEIFVRNQKRFLGDTAHELTAPIARIQFALGILEQRMESPDHPDIAVLHEEVQEMSHLVAELLHFTEAGMEPASTPLVAIGTAEIVRRAAEREGVAAEIVIDEALQVMALERPLLRALQNLLRNAARYAGAAGPIRVNAVREKGEVAITISDEGPGLPEEALARVFEPFFRLQESRNRDSGGAGLGLAIVKTCVEACRGSVRCMNRKPTGLAVQIRLAAG